MVATPKRARYSVSVTFSWQKDKNASVNVNEKLVNVINSYSSEHNAGNVSQF